MREEFTYRKNGKKKTKTVYYKDGTKDYESTYWKNGERKASIHYYEDGTKSCLLYTSPSPRDS